jgi:hypothetical protein
VARPFLLLVAATNVVTLLLAGSLTVRAVSAHARELHHFRTLGACDPDVRRLVAWWVARVVTSGPLAGAALGIVAAYAVYSAGNRLGLREPVVVPSPEPVALRMGLAPLGVAALVAGVVAIQAFLGAVASPKGFCAPGVEPVLRPEGFPAPGRASLPAHVVSALLEGPFVETAVPETFLYTVVQREPVIVQGGELRRSSRSTGRRWSVARFPRRARTRSS